MQGVEQRVGPLPFEPCPVQADVAVTPDQHLARRVAVRDLGEQRQLGRGAETQTPQPATSIPDVGGLRMYFCLIVGSFSR
jgi:hypothetical protein